MESPALPEAPTAAAHSTNAGVWGFSYTDPSPRPASRRAKEFISNSLYLFTRPRIDFAPYRIGSSTTTLEEPIMKTAAQFLMLAATAGLALLAATTRKPVAEPSSPEAPQTRAPAEADADAWFV